MVWWTEVWGLLRTDVGSYNSRNRTEKKLNEEAAKHEEKQKWEPGGLTLLLEGGLKPWGQLWPGAVAHDICAGEMAWWYQAMWLPLALLLLWVPGCLSLRGPSRVTGVVGGSLSVECRYAEKYKDNSKYWCKAPCLLPWKTVETKEPEREVMRGHVSIRDHPANLTFTVTLESLREDQAGTYVCGITVPFSLDPTIQVVVSVSPAPAPVPTHPTAVAETSTITISISTMSFTALAMAHPTYSASNEEEAMQGWGLQVLLALLALLLLLLGGISLLAWRMVQRRIKSGENPQPPQNPSQATERSEPCYENLELQMWPLLEQPVRPTQEEVEYSNLGLPSENLHYTSVVFDPRSQDSKTDRIPSQKPQTQEPVYSVVKKT
ncbi:CMRF35-like molecule 8 isoform X2 [Neophocaena asiaeorientalis asiaeorientalis]|uniref:CMRF35-like molecule 8 isoform X2 n=1 Tax=Neophocaena asiaeorientalis asiaeorientalis TaxID=1706337 RepID=A0A341CPI7_NEOAA|nr:CMRF35-like molecule 8 isoform X2 [Neophocaena asiaeorientalis asiaeorientalis]